MRTLRHAADHLEALHTPSGRFALASALGFSPIALPVDDDTRRRLDLPDTLADAHILRGPGALRALLVAAPTEPSLRALLSRLATSLSARTSHVLWLVIGVACNSDEVGLGCWTATPRGPRTLALIAQRNHIVASDAESLRVLAAAPVDDDLMVHTRWCELLGREALSRRFYRTLEQRVQALADSLTGMTAADRTELALLYVSRLLFLSFLETKGWLDGDHAFLSRQFDACMAAGGRFHQRVLLPLFFGTLNTRQRDRATVARQFGAIPFLNGGLFTKSPLERRHSAARFSDAALGMLFSDLLSAYRYSPREGEDQWSEAAIDPEMLGRAFESLMASRVRQVSGAFYTPQALVSHVVERALVAALAAEALDEDTVLAALRGETLPHDAAARLKKRLRHFTVLDPACGSGAFLVYVLERLTNLHRAAGDERGLAQIRRDVLARAIHGVDVNPTAVLLCELRLWLSVVIESDETRMSAVPPLPNLDCNVRVGDTLSGEAFTEPPSLLGPSAALARLRDRYVRAAGPRKAPLRRALAREERRRAISAIDRALTALTSQRRERLLAQRSTDLFGDRRKPSAEARASMRSQRLHAAALRRERRRIADDGALPFSFPSHFGAAHANGGFDLVIGNPPWVRLHNIPAASRAALRARYSVYRNAAWDPGTPSALGARGFAAQVDLAALFVERSLGLASAHGCVALLLPAKLWRSLSGGGVRRHLSATAHLRLVEDWSEAPSSFDAAVYPSVVIASRQPAAEECTELMDVGVRRRSLDVRWQGSASSLLLVPNDRASPWLLLPPDARHSFNRLLRYGVPLGNSHLGRAMLGVKCGCNDAFVVEAGDAHGDCVCVEHRGRKGIVERAMLRPLLRGDAMAAWSMPPSRSAIVWTHGPDGRPLRTLPPSAARWLAPWRRQLLSRTDLYGKAMWWSLFRTEGADHSRARVAWSDFGRVPKAALLAADDPTVPLNSCYVLACDDVQDALTLTALLNGPLAAAWLNAIAEPARGGWHRYLAWTVSLLPLPRDWCRARSVLAPLAQRGIDGMPPTDEELLSASCHAYRVRAHDIAPLVAWCHTPTLR